MLHNIKYLAVLIIVSSCITNLTAQSRRNVPTKTLTIQTNSDREKAFELIKQGRPIDALPLLEKVAATNPKDSEFWAQYGIAIMARSVTLKDAAERKSERLAARSVLSKARSLGTDNPIALDFLTQIPEDGGEDSYGGSENVDNLIRDGENFYGKGDFENAFKSYQRAYQLDPKNYFAALFAGDTFYARKMYPQADEWFAKAVAIDADRETAFRYWGDSLLNQNKFIEARDKYVEALIADPTSNTSLQAINNWVSKAKVKPNPLDVVPPGGKYSGDIVIDETLLKAEDGTKNWLLYNATRDAWKKQLFKQNFPKETEYRRTLREETAALRIVASKSREDLKTGRVKKLDESLSNLIKLDDAGFLEPYVLFERNDEEIAQDYVEYRKNNREKLHRFFVEAIINGK